VEISRAVVATELVAHQRGVAQHARLGM
jgi:hypothetical protein